VGLGAWREAITLNGDALAAASRLAEREASAFSAMFCAIACDETPITSIAAKASLVLVRMIVAPPIAPCPGGCLHRRKRASTHEGRKAGAGYESLGSVCRDAARD